MKKAVEYIVVTDGKYHYTHGYYTANKWTREGDLILSRSVDETMNNKKDPIELILYSLEKRCAEEVLCDDALGFSSHVVYDNMLYYTAKDGFKSINLDTKERKTLYKYGDVRFCLPHITNDGKYITLEGRNNDGECEFLRINTDTGEGKVLLKKRFLPPLSEADHGMICPENPDIIFFAHEGVTHYITNRMWAYDVSKDKMWNISNQAMTEDNDLGEYYGHEMWAPDGKGMYFVKYPQSPIKPTGLCYVALGNKEKKELFSGYAYWHTGASKDGKYLIADTMRGVYDGTDLSEIVVADLTEKTESVIDVVHATGTHPCHPHPQMSPDSSKVVYTAFENGMTVVRIAILY